MNKSETRKKGSALVKSNGNGVEKSYVAWIADLKRRYRATQIKAAVAVNSAMLEFYWTLGRDISGKYPGKKRNLGFFDNPSNDLCLGIKNPVGLSARNLRYSLAFYQLYSYRQQVVADNCNGALLPQITKELSSMKSAVARLGAVVDATIADVERQIAVEKKGGGE